MQGRRPSEVWFARGRPRDLFPFSEAGKSPSGTGAPLAELGLRKDRAALAEFLGDCVGDDRPERDGGREKETIIIIMGVGDEVGAREP